MNANAEFLTKSANIIEPAHDESLKSRKIYVKGTRSDLLVPMRKITLTDSHTDRGTESNGNFFTYDKIFFKFVLFI